MDSIVSVLGQSFSGTVIEDPVMEPYFITITGGETYTVSRKRIDKTGALRYIDISYPSSFESCVLRVAKEQMNDKNKAYSSLQSYIDEWKGITSKILNAYKEKI